MNKTELEGIYMFGKELAHDETYFKEYGEYKVNSSFTVYESYIEVMRDKDGNVVVNKDGSPRYRTVNEASISQLEENKTVKEIREGFYKDVFQVNGDYVELKEKDGRRMYFVVDQERIKTLEKGTSVIAKNGTYRLLGEVGYVLVEDIEVEKPKILAIRKFKTDDHKKEAEEIVKARTRKFREEE